MWSSDQYPYLLDCDPGQPGWGRPPTYRLIVTFDVAVTVRCAAALRQRHVSIALCSLTRMQDVCLSSSGR
jgi:hypothetical protein